MTAAAMPSRPKNPRPLRIEFPPELPISARADEIIGLLQSHQVVVLAGETGSGKTTQIPKLCLAAGSGLRGRIACTQPRRVAALSVSRRVAEELNVAWGREVGCKVRFADETSPETVVKFLTDGMLLAELHGDPDLREYDTIIVDEAHERSLNIDFLLGHLRRLRRRRPELRIVITSATIDTAAFSAAFDQAPVVEVSGRVYPVEVIYSPLEEMQGDAGDYTYIDAAVEAVGRVLRESAAGDVLVFLPTERDLREVADRLAGAGPAKGRKAGPGLEIVPLFGRLTNAEQQRAFAPAAGRKVVVATNIAETSLTIPGIRFVIDTGLARISRYVPQSRTRRLPVEPIAQSSADQRKGRCGRVSDGVCIRLYREPDYRARPRFATPEIQRCNLADVILRMKAFGLGAIEEFPFLNAPPAKGVRAGYALLEELGALGRGAETGSGAGWEITELGRELARLPVDPTIGRMILQARAEKALREVLIIGAALTIQDPRERPLDRQPQADAAHRRFTHPDSDFLTLLAIWEAYHDEFETMTLGRLRRFCDAHFLSFLRMREWRDVHGQLAEALAGREDLRPSSIHDGVKRGQEVSLAPGTPAYAAIHRSILAGLLGNVAVRGADGTWHATHDRKVAVFPGSALFEKTVRGAGVREGRAAKPGAARWLMAAEIMETGRVYARTCARIDPRWALDLGRHLLRVAHSEPFWSAEAGRVLVKERRRLYNLELETRAVGYGKINPAHATEIFLREGLAGDTVTAPWPFLAHNRRVRAEAETVLTRLRSASYLDLDEAAYRFYAARLGPVAPGEEPALAVSSVAELNERLRHGRPDAKALCMTAEDLRLPAGLEPDRAAFPDALPLENRALPLNYAYKPGQPDDGVTLRLGAAEAAALHPAALDWAVPGHLAEKIELLLKALPKEQRRRLIPFAETARQVAAEAALRAGRAPPPTLAEALAEILTARLGVRIDARHFAERPLPEHLRVRVEVVDGRGQVLGASRDLAELQAQLGARQQETSRKAARDEGPAWRAARARWETAPADDWRFGDLPAEVVVEERHGLPVRAHPGLAAVESGVAVRLFASPGEARAATRAGLRRLAESRLRYELGWLERDLRALRALGPLAVTLAPLEDLQRDALEAIRRWVCGRDVQPLHAVEFARRIDEAKHDLRGLAPRVADRLREILTLRTALLAHPQPYPGLEAEVAELLPPDFLRRLPFDRLEHLPRYLKGRLRRAERWKLDPAKDAQRASALAPFAEATRRPGGGDFRWLVEEFRVSLFAQELGTAEPVSAVRLERELKAAGGAPAPDPPAPARPATLPAKGRTVLKSLDALGNLPR